MVTTMHRRPDRPYKILIVDDGDDFRKAFREFLTHFGYQIQEASNGQEALDLLREPCDIDLVLLDVQMPGLSGIDVLAKIRKNSRQLAVIILTGHSAQDIEASIPEGYVQGCIEKMTDPRRVGILIEKVLKKK